MKESAELLRAVADLVEGSRRSSHGPAEAVFKRTAEFWSLYLQVSLTPRDVAMLNLLQKVSRAECGGENTDDYMDMAGYASLAAFLKPACKDGVCDA